jgi:hypothetical protein
MHDITNTRLKASIGGKAIGSGGYGCVFHPALYCVNNKITPSNLDNYISKVMTNKHANTEYKIIREVNKKLQNIKDHEDYFLTYDLRKCKIKKLSRKDKQNYTKKCKPLLKKNITYKNINKRLDKITSITMPHGGMDVNDYIYSSINNYDKMTSLFNSLSKLTKNGIVAMNAAKIYHGDLKASNLMIKENQVKVIDWGLSFSQKKQAVYNDMASGRPFQFNIPFSCVLINHEFQKEYREYISVNPSPSRNNIKKFVSEFIDRWNTYRGTGSLDLLYYIYGGLLQENPSKTLIKHEVHPVIVNYLVNIVDEYTERDVFHFQKYYNQIYLSNLDLWGMVTSVVSVYDLLLSNIKILNSVEKEALSIIANLFQHILKADTTRISSQLVVQSFQKVSDIYQIKKKPPLKITERSQNVTRMGKSNKKLTTKKISSKTLKKSLATHKSISVKNRTRKKYF